MQVTSVLAGIGVPVGFELVFETADVEPHIGRFRSDPSFNPEYWRIREEPLRKAIVGKEEAKNSCCVPIGNIRNDVEGSDGRNIHASGILQIC